MLGYILSVCLIVVVQGRTTSQPTTPLPTTPSEPTTTTLRDITECELGRIRGHSDPNKFEQLTQDENGTDVWVVSDCQQELLIFDDTLCACVHPLLPSCPYNEVDGSSVEYQEVLSPFSIFTCTVANTFWNQTGCRCDWNPDGPQAAPVVEVEPCETIFSTTFADGELSDINIQPYTNVLSVPALGANGKALVSLPTHGALVWKVSYTDFGPGFAMNFRFKARNDIELRERFVALVTNGCWSEETIAISYRSIDRSYQVNLGAFLLETRSREEIRFTCQDTSAVSDGFQWNTVALSFRQGVINLMVNDVLCRNEEVPTAVPDKPKCPLVLGHDFQPDNPRDGLFGWFDDFSVRRFCPN